MIAEPRKTGDNIVDDTAWGTHGCLFYVTKRDLLDALIPFFRTGLQEGEQCLWIISAPLTVEAAMDALRQAVTNLDRHLTDESMELVAYGRTLDLPRFISSVREKIEGASERGYAGLRATVDTGWLEKQGLRDYENALSHSIASPRMITLCTYPMDRSGAAELLDAARSHQVCASMRNGELEILDAPEIQELRKKIKTLNPLFGHAVMERRGIPDASKDDLRREMDERKRIEDEPRKQKEMLQKIIDHIPVMINFMGPGGRIKLVNREWVRTLGWTLEEIRKDNLDILAACYPNLHVRQEVLNFIAHSNGEWKAFKTRVRDGRTIDTSWVMTQLSDGTSIGIGRDITERKEWEDRLRATSDQLRALSARIQAGREEERSRMARLIHDELGSACTGLKWDLESLGNALTPPLDQPAEATLRAKIAVMKTLTDGMINTVRRIAWELRPSILDDLGLVEAIEWQAQQFEARTGIVCRRDQVLKHVLLNAEQSTAIFRIFQEALTNILRHAKATEVDITMALEAEEFVLTIRDNGRGIAGIEKAGLGILGMQERARLVGGKIDIQGIDGAGTTIAVRVPVVLQESHSTK